MTKLVNPTLSYNTSYNTSSSKVTPIAEAPVVEDLGEEEDNKHYGKPKKRVVPYPKNPIPIQKDIRPLDMKTISAQMMEIWNRICPVAKVAGEATLSFLLLSRFNESFNKSFEDWERYCKMIARSKFLMGERPMHNGKFFTLSLIWALSFQNIIKVKNGMYDADRAIPLPKHEYEALLQKTKQSIRKPKEIFHLRRNRTSEQTESGLRTFGNILDELRGRSQQMAFANRA
jgi:hypothetical protein